MTIRKLNNTMYEKFLLQAEEAKELGMEKLGNAVMGSIGPEFNEIDRYSFGELEKDVYQGFWKLAINVVEYHGLESADIEKMDEEINILARKFVDEIEKALGVEENKIGPKDIVIGEEKV